MATAAITIRARSLANVLADLKEARRDLDAAGNDARDLDQDNDVCDRYAEAETRRDDLLAEFDVTLAEATGLSVEDVRSAFAQAVI